MSTLLDPNAPNLAEELFGCPHVVAWWLERNGGDVAGYARARGPLTHYLKGSGLPFAAAGPTTWDTAGYLAGPQLPLPGWAIEAQQTWDALPSGAPISGTLAAWIIRDVAERLGLVEDEG